MTDRFFTTAFALVLALLSHERLSHAQSLAQPVEGLVHEFNRQGLSSVYFSEGTAAGDLNRDGVADIAYGPYWYAGPDFKKANEIFPPKAQSMLGYADHFFAWIHDFNGDGWNDILAVGFPGTPAFVYENPGVFVEAGNAKPSPFKHWRKHQVLDSVGNESPQFVDLTGDGKPELVCTKDGCFGFAQPKEKSFESWEFRRISPAVAPKQFGHGLGVGDVDGDGRNDLLTSEGWLQQPKDTNKAMWDVHPFAFAQPGGADMHAYDVNGDGLNDVITSIDAHGWGLVWWEQARDSEGKISFKRNLIMGSRPSENPYGIYVSEPHSVALSDVDGDGLKDIITGKTYWSHHRQSPNWDADPMVYWFKLKRNENEVEWVPHLVDDKAGIGRQIVATDLDGNGLLDVITGGMLGCHVMRHTSRHAKGDDFIAHQPKKRLPLANGLTGPEAARNMTVPQGFRVQLAAAEPLVHQPVAMTIDSRGRVWIAEAHTYPIRAPEGKGSDRIIILEDTDLDGTLDKRTVFVEGLNLVSGLEVGFGGVWVGAAPYFMFIPDSNSDDKPDSEPVILLDGFGYQDTHETLNGFNWGPDGWLYGCHGVFTHSLVGKPGQSEKNRTPLNAGYWRYHPVQHQFEVFAWGTSNPWGIDFNDYGQAFATACVIPHLYHVVQGGRYQRQAGQHFEPHTYDDIKTIADHSHFAGNIADHAWWGHEPLIPTDTSDAGGGHAHCGAMVYLGDNWPDRYRNSVFMNNIHGNRVNVDRLVRRGSGYVGRHADDLLLANDRWFRGINLRCGPDGSVYLIDWYDPNACHRVNPEIWDRTNGRVYNISYGNTNRTSVDLDKLSDVELAKLSLSKNDWYVRIARRILQHRAAQGVLNQSQVRREIVDLLKLDDDTRVLRGLWLGHATGLMSEPEMISLLTHESAYVRAWSVQMLCENKAPSSTALKLMEEMSRQTGGDPIVRLALASAAQRLPLDQRWSLMEGLVQHASDGDDHNLPLVIWYGLEPLISHDAKRSIGIFKSAQIPLLRQFVVRRSASHEPALEALMEQIADAKKEEQESVLKQLLLAYEGNVDTPMPKSWSLAFDRLMKTNEPSIQDLTGRLAVQFGDKRVFPELRKTLANSDAPLQQRQRALEILVKARDRESAESLHAALTSIPLQSAALKALAALGNAETPRRVIDIYPKLDSSAKEHAVATLAGRAESAATLLDAIASGAIPRRDVHAFHIRQMTNIKNPKLTERIEKEWGRVTHSTEEQRSLIEKQKALLKNEKIASANVGHGRFLFQKHCASCHKLFGAGESVGPDLTGSNRADLDYVLENLIAPNAVVGRDYQMNVILKLDGQVVSGLITKETESALTVKTINDLVVIAKDEIEEKKVSELSLMPTGLMDSLSTEERMDLIAYLASPVQVPVRGPSVSIDAQTGKVVPSRGDVVIEGESLVEAVGADQKGKVSQQDMRGFSADRWSGNDHLWWVGSKPGDRLTVEIEVAETAQFQIEAVFTRARDYGIVRVFLDDEPLGEDLDLFNEPEVMTTGLLTLGSRKMVAGKHRIAFEIVGANPQAVKSYMFGLDFLRLNKEQPKEEALK